MSEISIPDEVVTGFKAIGKLSGKSIQQITDYLNNAKVSSAPNDILKGLADFIMINLKNKSYKDIVLTISSFVGLIKEDSAEKLSEKLATSFKEKHSRDITERDFLSLKNNLEKILSACNNLEFSVKAYTLKRESINIYSKSKIVSDIRIVFNKTMDSKNRKAVLIHNLHITYISNSKNKNFFAALDLDDLKKLQEQIERAIKKDDLIKREYTDFELI